MTKKVLMDFFIILPSLIVLMTMSGTASGTTFQWTPDGTWQRALQQPGNAVCVDIPSNMSLCHGIGYTKMRLPNLLHHDSLQEVSQQAISWIPLFQLNCHPDTQIFLCSLFTPVCLEHPIPPCRSLCLTVQSSCEDTMSKYGFPWPHIVRCDQFPVDNDMCIMAQHGLAGGVLGLPDGVNASNSQPVELYHDGTPKGTLVPSQVGKAREEPKKRRKSKKNRSKIIPSTPLPDLTTSPPTSHVHHHLQTITEQQEMRKEASPPAEVSGIQSSSISTSSSDNKVHVQERILSGYCHSDWSLKVRASATTSSDGSITLHVKSYRVLWGSSPTSDIMKPSLITIPANVSQEIASSASDNMKSAEEDKTRFYVMGNTKGNLYLANFAIFWPHKSPHFRKALKDIQTGSVECSLSTVAPSTTTVEVSTAPPGNSHQNLKGEKRRRRKGRRKLHHHQHHQQHGQN